MNTIETKKNCSWLPQTFALQKIRSLRPACMLNYIGRSEWCGGGGATDLFGVGLLAIVHLKSRSAYTHSKNI